MSSFERTGARHKAVAAEPPAAPIPPAGDDDRADDDPASAHPWFTPGRKQPAAASDGDESADWFLPTGRAGLLPDSMTDSWQDGTVPSPGRPAQAVGTGSPPWAAESADTSAGAPPPWETGPWPGPGDGHPPSRPSPATDSSDPAANTTVPASPRRRAVQLGLAAGVGVVVIIVVIVVIVTGTSGGPAGGCGTYPAAVRQAYGRAMTDPRDHASASVQSAALARAASLANASAAAPGGQMKVRTAMFAMASDLDRAHADVMANRALPSTLLQHLTADGTVLPAACPG